jgi:DNA repair protein RAD5
VLSYCVSQCLLYLLPANGVFRCRDCIVAFIEKQEDNGKEAACPACGKAPILINQLREKGQSRNEFYKSQPALKKVNFQTSTKLTALIKRLKAIELEDPHYKALVFSQVSPDCSHMSISHKLNPPGVVVYLYVVVD